MQFIERYLQKSIHCLNTHKHHVKILRKEKKKKQQQQNNNM